MTLLAPTPWTPQSTRPQGRWSDSRFVPQGELEFCFSLLFFLAGASFFFCVINIILGVGLPAGRVCVCK